MNIQNNKISFIYIRLQLFHFFNTAPHMVLVKIITRNILLAMMLFEIKYLHRYDRKHWNNNALEKTVNL